MAMAGGISEHMLTSWSSFVGFHVKMNRFTLFTIMIACSKPVHGKRNYFTLFLVMYYDCLVKVRGGSMYYGIIF